MCLPSNFWELQNSYRLILFLNFHIKYNQLYFYLSLSLCQFATQSKSQRDKTPVFSIKTSRAILKMHSAELKIESILNLMLLTRGRFVNALFTECYNNTINI